MTCRTARGNLSIPQVNLAPPPCFEVRSAINVGRKNLRRASRRVADFLRMTRYLRINGRYSKFGSTTNRYALICPMIGLLGESR